MMSTVTGMSRKPIEDAIALLRANYVFPDKAEAAAAAIQARLDAGEYDGMDEAMLGDRLTTQLFELCGDKHLRVRIRAAELHQAMSEAELLTAYQEMWRLGNYGITRVERLDGNVGYLDLWGMTDPGIGGDAIAAAMRLVAETHVLIVDLRKGRGGAPEGVIFWNSYLFPDGETHLNNIFRAATGQTRQFWSMPYVPGERYLDRPVYVLTSDTTFSGAEEFCYNLKVQGRATLIGETTRGGAHPTEAFALTPTLEITVPNARSVNPVTGTNWEGTGVEPDIAVPSEKAFDVAYRKALEHVLATSPSPTVRDQARAALAGIPEGSADGGSDRNMA